MMQFENRNGITLVRMDPAYSAFNDELLAEAESGILRAVQSEPKPRIVLDFTDTEYFSSMFIEVLFRVWNAVQQKHGRFALCSLRPVCREILDTAKLNTIWDIYSTADDAVNALTTP